MEHPTQPILSFSNGDQIAALGLGTWKSGPGEVYRAVREAIRIGYRHFDCAAIYGNEEEIGTALRDAMAEGDVARPDLWITSKLWNNAHHPESVAPALKESLRKLQLEYLDLYLMHWPVALQKGVSFPSQPSEFVSLEEVPLAATWQALEACVDKELCRHLGVSNFSVKKLAGLLPQTRIRPEMNQVELHPYLQQAALLEFCREQGIYLTAYSPLGSTDRPERVRRAQDPILLEDPVVRRIADAHGRSPAQVMIRWAIQRGTTVIPKSANPVRLKENFEAQFFELSGSAMQEISVLDRHFRYIHGGSWTLAGGPYTIQNLWDDQEAGLSK